MLVTAIAGFGGPQPAVAANDLNQATVQPHLGTTDTTFQFTVRFSSSPNRRALNVDAQVAGLTIPLTLISGTETDGKWRGFSQVPEGNNWSVTFVAQADGSDPTTTGPEITVTAAPPTPTPVPTPAPTAQPTAAPTATPTAATATPIPSGFASARPTPLQSAPIGGPVAPGAPPPQDSGAPNEASASPSLISGAFGGGLITQPSAMPSEAAPLPAPAADPSPKQVDEGIARALPLISGSLIAFGLFGIAGALAVERDRRRRWLHRRLERAVDTDRPPPSRWLMRR